MLYQYLATLAADAGAKIMVRSRVSGLFSNPQYKTDRLEAVTSTGNLEINTKLVIDASGFSSIIGRKLGLVSSWKRYGIGAEYECYCDSVDRETWYLMVGKQYSDAGYAWVFPLSKIG